MSISPDLNAPDPDEDGQTITDLRDADVEPGGWKVSRRTEAGDWILLGTDVEGATRRTAVRTITQHLEESMQWGQFLVERDGEVRILTRTRIPVQTFREEWS